MRHRRRGSSCPHCGLRWDPFGRCRRKICPKYGPIWLGDWQVVLLNALAGIRNVYLITTTGPGVDEGMVWDRSLCTHPPGVSCSGPRGCRVLAIVADRFNSTFSRDMSRLHRAVMARVAREFPGMGPIIAARTDEYQQRGLLHRHMGGDASTPRQAARLRTYVRYMNLLGPRYGFGRTQLEVREGKQSKPGGLAAGYLAKYLGKATSENFSISRPAFVGHHLTKESGVTMRAMRWRRFVYVRFGIRPHTDELGVWIELLRCFPGLEVDPLRSAPALPPPH